MAGGAPDDDVALSDSEATGSEELAQAAADAERFSYFCRGKEHVAAARAAAAASAPRGVR